MDGRNGIRGGCVRCTLLCDIWESSLRLNHLIRQFNPNHDDVSKPPAPKEYDDRQLSLI